MVERRPRHRFPGHPSTLNLPESGLPNSLELDLDDDPVFYVCDRQGRIVNGNNKYRDLVTELSKGRHDEAEARPFPPTRSTLAQCYNVLSKTMAQSYATKLLLSVDR